MVWALKRAVGVGTSELKKFRKVGVKVPHPDAMPVTLYETGGVFTSGQNGR